MTHVVALSGGKDSTAMALRLEPPTELDRANAHRKEQWMDREPKLWNLIPCGVCGTKIAWDDEPDPTCDDCVRAELKRLRAASSTPPSPPPREREIQIEWIAKRLESTQVIWAKDLAKEIRAKFLPLAQPPAPPTVVEDNPEWDATDAAHPAWWRGHDHTSQVFCDLVTKILDGKDDGRGFNHQPWHDLRQRLLKLAAPPSDPKDPYSTGLTAEAILRANAELAPPKRCKLGPDHLVHDAECGGAPPSVSAGPRCYECNVEPATRCAKCFHAVEDERDALRVSVSAGRGETDEA